MSKVKANLPVAGSLSNASIAEIAAALFAIWVELSAWEKRHIVRRVEEGADTFVIEIPDLEDKLDPLIKNPDLLSEEHGPVTESLFEESGIWTARVDLVEAL